MNEDIYIIGYARVSSAKQAQIGEGLERQERDIKTYCKDKGWKLFGEQVFLEPFTGTNTDRPAYNQILQLLKSNGKGVNIRYFVFWDFDRLTRAGTIDYEQIWEDVKTYGVALRDTAGVIQDEVDYFAKYGLKHTYKFAVARPSEDTERTRVEDARKDRIKILRRLTAPQIERTQDGYHIGPPNYGFRNAWIYVDGKKKCIQERKEDEAIYVEKIFERRAHSPMTDEEIANEVNAMGYKSKIKNHWSKSKLEQIGTKGGVKMTEKHVQELISKTYYAGVLIKKMNNYKARKSQYKGLVSIETWNKANRGKLFIQEHNDGIVEILKNVGVHGKKRYKLNPYYPYKGVLKCELCGKNMKASANQAF
jgi:DNA invertase Pin-like site-specific DNA recombinase